MSCDRRHLNCQKKSQLVVGVCALLPFWVSFSGLCVFRPRVKSLPFVFGLSLFASCIWPRQFFFCRLVTDWDHLAFLVLVNDW